MKKELIRHLKVRNIKTTWDMWCESKTYFDKQNIEMGGSYSTFTDFIIVRVNDERFHVYIEEVNIPKREVTIKIDEKVTKCQNCPLCYRNDEDSQYCMKLDTWISGWDYMEKEHGDVWLGISKKCPFLKNK
jgi:hypothetical protein